MNYGAGGATRLWSGVALAALLAGGGCDKQRAIGDANQILVGAPTEAWQTLERDIKDALEPRTFTVRDERVFDVAHADPQQTGWDRLRLMRQVLLIGTGQDPAVSQALDSYRGDPPTAPGVVQVRNVWAQNQLVTVALLPSGGDPASARPLLPQIGEMYLRQFEEYARARMFVTSPNQALRDSLRSQAGFSLLLPQVYRYSEVEPRVFVFRNDQHHNDAARIIRNLTVASRRRGEVDFTPAAALAWREELAARHTQPPQVTDTVTESHAVLEGRANAFQIQGVWSNPPGEWPAAGPFLTRMVDCGERIFLADAWLYAPGVSKYEYMYQLTTALDSFECAG